MSEKRRNRYALRAFFIVIFLMAINPANCSSGREFGVDEYIVRVIITSIMFGVIAASLTWVVQWMRERKYENKKEETKAEACECRNLEPKKTVVKDQRKGKEDQYQDRASAEIKEIEKNESSAYMPEEIPKIPTQSRTKKTTFSAEQLVSLAAEEATRLEDSLIDKTKQKLNIDLAEFRGSVKRLLALYFLESFRYNNEEFDNFSDEALSKKIEEFYQDALSFAKFEPTFSNISYMIEDFGLQLSANITEKINPVNPSGWPIKPYFGQWFLNLLGMSNEPIPTYVMFEFLLGEHASDARKRVGIDE